MVQEKPAPDPHGMVVVFQREVQRVPAARGLRACRGETSSAMINTLAMSLAANANKMRGRCTRRMSSWTASSGEASKDSIQ